MTMQDEIINIARVHKPNSRIFMMERSNEFGLWRIEFEVTEEFYAKMFSRNLEIIFRAQNSGMTEAIDLDVINV